MVRGRGMVWRKGMAWGSGVWYEGTSVYKSNNEIHLFKYYGHIIHRLQSYSVIKIKIKLDIKIYILAVFLKLLVDNQISIEPY